MANDVHLDIHETTIAGLTLPGGMVDFAVMKAARTTAFRARMNVVQSGRVNTGALVLSIKEERALYGPTRSTWRVGSDLEYAIFQELGIGPVHARPGGVLRFKPKGAVAYIYRPRTKGFEGAHFLEDALRRLTAHDYT